MPARLLLLEDEQAIADSLLYVLRSEGFEVVHHRLARDALAEVERQVPDLALLDVGLPDGNGFDVCRALRRSHGLPIVFLTARDDEIDRVLGLELGADDYVGKPFSPREVCARVKAVLRRNAPQATDDLVELGGLSLDPATHRVTAGGTEINLGPTEFRLLHFLMAHPERVHGRSQLLDQVWGDHVFVEERTVDVHIRRLRAALETTGHDNLIQTVRGSGYRISVQ